MQVLDPVIELLVETYSDLWSRLRGDDGGQCQVLTPDLARDPMSPLTREDVEIELIRRLDLTQAPAMPPPKRTDPVVERLMNTPIACL